MATAGCALTTSAISGGIEVDVEVAVQADLAQLGDQAGVVLGGEERRVHPEHLGDPQQHRDGQRPDVVFDLVEVAGEISSVCASAAWLRPAFGAELTHP